VLYWYISAENPEIRNGQIERGFDGPYNSEKEAESAGFQIFPGLMFKKHQYATRDKAKATSQWKHQLAGDIGAFNALRPVRHPDKRDITEERHISR
jgi:hypothetical protein